MHRLALYMFLVLLTGTGLVTFQGCSEDNPDDPGSSSITSPKVGSTYTYNYYETEEGNKVDATEETLTVEVIETGIEVGGKTNVTHFRQIGTLGDTSDIYLKYESNNDVSLWLDLAEDGGIEGVDPRWITLPYGSKSGQNYTLIDTVADNGMGGMDTLKMTLASSWVREETVQYQGSDMKVWVGKLAQDMVFPFPIVPGLHITFHSDIEFTFAPSIGYVYSVESESESDGEISGDVQTLTSYTLK